MAKTFITSGTGASQTLDAIQNEKVPVYSTRADAEADIANIVEGGIVATKDTGATGKVVDVVEDGNMNPVTSNAVADLLLVEEDTGVNITVEPGGYAEWQTGISSIKTGYRLISLTAMPLVNDAILTTIHSLSDQFRVTIFNSAGVQQTQSVRLTVVWMKDI